MAERRAPTGAVGSDRRGGHALPSLATSTTSARPAAASGRPPTAADPRGAPWGTASSPRLRGCRRPVLRDPDVVWAGFGEVQFRGNVIPGDGVYRSTDAGETWTHVGLALPPASRWWAASASTPRLRPGLRRRPRRPFGPNEERGVFRTTDGGETWERSSSGRPRRRGGPGHRSPNPRSSTPDSGRSTERTGAWSGGTRQRPLQEHRRGRHLDRADPNPGPPEGMWGKVGVSVSGADPNRVYAIVEAEDGGVFVVRRRGRDLGAGE
jgi:hypothetical protein